MLAQRAATGKVDASASAGWAGEISGPRWMRAVRRPPGRPLKEEEKEVLAQCAQEKTTQRPACGVVREEGEQVLDLREPWGGFIESMQPVDLRNACEGEKKSCGFLL